MDYTIEGTLEIKTTSLYTKAGLARAVLIKERQGTRPQMFRSTTRQDPTQFFHGQLPGRDGCAEVGVIKKTAAARELDARQAAQFTDSHRDKLHPAAVAVEEIEKRIQLRRGVRANSDFDDVRA